MVGLLVETADLSSKELLPPVRDKFTAAAGRLVKAAAALMQIVDDPSPPLRVLLGVMAFDLAQEAYHRRLAEWDRTKVLARSTELTDA